MRAGCALGVAAAWPLAGLPVYYRRTQKMIEQ